MDCVFCKKINEGSVNRADFTIDDLEREVYHFEPLNPVTPGHRLFVPGIEFCAPSPITAPITTGVLFNAASIWASYTPDVDFNLIINSGPDASQSINHLHVHYIPRRPGDGLILPWTNQKKSRCDHMMGGQMCESIEEGEHVHYIDVPIKTGYGYDKIRRFDLS